jgi:hypothetical protein
VLLPLTILDFQPVSLFRYLVWPLGLLLLVLIVIDALFAVNYRLYYLLEREDWPALALYLEKRVMDRGRYSSGLVQVLVNAYLALKDTASVMALENRLAAAKPALLDKHGLAFGAARLLAEDYSGARRFFEARIASPGLQDRDVRDWLTWYYGFSLLLDYRYEKAAEVFLGLSRVSVPPRAPAVPLVTGLSAWLLHYSLAKALPPRSGEFEGAAQTGRELIRKRLPVRAAWEKELVKVQAEIHAVMVMKYLRDAADWIYEK